MATTAALLPPPLLSAVEIHPPLFTHHSLFVGDVIELETESKKEEAAQPMIFDVRGLMFDGMRGTRKR
jgi:hypothetical protein